MKACHEALERLQAVDPRYLFCHHPDKNVPIEEISMDHEPADTTKSCTGVPADRWGRDHGAHR